MSANTDPLERFRLDGKVALVTGASSGLGAGFAHALAAVGAQLVIAARREDRLQQVSDELAATGASVLACKLDVANPDDCIEVVERTAHHFGTIDVLINNAGVGQAGTALREDPQIFRQVIDINLNGSYWMARACAPHMPNGSSIVNIASVHSWAASRFPQAAYSASKAGIVGLTRDLAQQWTGRRGIRVNALCPGYIATEMTTSGNTDRLTKMVIDNSIMGRFGTQAELDSAMLFLASPASSYMTGASLIVDGGLCATV